MLKINNGTLQFSRFVFIGSFLNAVGTAEQLVYQYHNGI